MSEMKNTVDEMECTTEKVGKIESRQMRILKKKCNKLIEIAENLRKENLLLKEQVQTQMAIPNSQNTDFEKSMLEQYINEFTKLVKKAEQEGALIPYVYDTKLAKQFVKIEKDKFEELVKTCVSIDFKNFMQISIKMQLVCGKTIRIKGQNLYLVSKGFCELVLPEAFEKNKDTEDEGVMVG